MKILIVFVAVIAFIIGWGKTDGSTVTGVIYAVIATITLLMLKSSLKKGTWQCQKCTDILYNCRKPLSDGCRMGGQHLWNKINDN